MSSATKTRSILILLGSVALAALLFFFSKILTHSRREIPKFEDSTAQSPEASASGVAPATDSSPGIETTSTPSAEASLSPATRSQLRVLDEILASKNDNDPRMDTELRTLSPEARAALKAKYQTLRKEDRNGRGTIVFLLGLNLDSPQDFSFMEQVLNEEPCVGLEDCTKLMKPGSGEEAHEDTGVDVTLNYPQMVALSSIEKLLDSGATLSLVRLEAMRQTIRVGKASSVPMIARKAADLEARLPGA